MAGGGDLSRYCRTCRQRAGHPCRAVKVGGGLGGPTRTHAARLATRKTLSQGNAPTRKRAARWRPTAAQLARWEKRRMECLRRDGFRCRRCGRQGTLWDKGDGVVRCSDLEVAHIVGLGSGRSRFKTWLPINQLANLATLCSPEHRSHDQEHAWTWEEIGITPDESLRGPSKAA